MQPAQHPLLFVVASFDDSVPGGVITLLDDAGDASGDVSGTALELNCVDMILLFGFMSSRGNLQCSDALGLVIVGLIPVVHLISDG